MAPTSSNIPHPVVAKPSVAVGATTAAASSEDTIFGVPKWALAVAAGGVVFVGLAYYVLSAPSDGNSKGGGSKLKKPKKVNTPSGGSKTGSTGATPTKKNDVTLKKDEHNVTIEDVGEDEETVSKHPDNFPVIGIGQILNPKVQCCQN